MLMVGLCIQSSICYCQSVDDEPLLICSFIYAQGSSVILPQLGDNSIEFSRLDDFIRTVLSKDSLSLLHIRLTGYCSIEGGYSFNTQLSRNRVKVFSDYLQSTYPMFQHYTLDEASVPEDWQGLLEQVRGDAEMPDREEVLLILRNGSSSDSRKRLLRDMNGGGAYAYMEQVMFPNLRRVELTVSLHSPSAPLRHLPLAGEEIHAASNSLSFGEGLGEAVGESWGEAFGLWGEGVARVKPVSRFSVKINLLYLAGLTRSGSYTTIMPNLSIEYYLTSAWSVEVGAKYSNWHYNTRQSFQGISGYRLETRYYFFRNTYDPISDIFPFMGIYGRFGDFNLRQAQYCTGKYTDYGLCGGLYIQLFRWLSIELGARAGYVMGIPTFYQLQDDYMLYEYKSSYNKFRITDLCTNLVYRF